MSTDRSDIRQVTAPTLDDVRATARVIAAELPPTPVVAGWPPGSPPLWLKLETLQPTGSFKVRGALSALSRLPADAHAVTASAGNHALGMAFAAERLGRRVTVVTSTTASPVKIAALSRYGVELVQVGTSYDDAERHALELAAAGAVFVSAYNDGAVIAGQGSVGLELDEQMVGPLTVVCGVGGGGLASGLGLWASGRGDVRVVGVETVASMALSAAVRAGHQVPVEVGETLADGMAGNIEPGSVTVDLVARNVSELVTVTEDEIRQAIRYLALERGVVAEGSGAAPVAAVLAGRVASEAPVVAVVTGRNIRPDVLDQIIAEQADSVVRWVRS